MTSQDHPVAKKGSQDLNLKPWDSEICFYAPWLCPDPPPHSAACGLGHTTVAGEGVAPERVGAESSLGLK